MIPLLFLFTNQFKREWIIQVRQIRTLINSSLFFLMILFVFPLTLNADPSFLKEAAPGIIWMALLLSFLLSAEGLFQHDYEQGVVEQWLISGDSLSVIVAAKITAHWVVTLLPVVCLSPFIALIFSFSPWEWSILLITLLVGSPSILFVCALASVFEVGVNQKGALMALILLPLTLPVLIFASGALNMAIQGLAISAICCLLLAFSMICVCFLPIAIACVLRVSHAE